MVAYLFDHGVNLLVKTMTITVFTTYSLNSRHPLNFKSFYMNYFIQFFPQTSVWVF